ncbi:MAG TPA: hypothetical protein VFH27_02565 [Longimicrobiaceae bacterium]|nr:hypothetical protein [Longimicrobiaceae bacterium]
MIDRGPAASPVIAPAPSPGPPPARGGCLKIGCLSLLGAIVLFVLFISWAAHKGSRAPVGGEDLEPAQVVAKTGSRSIVVERRRGGQWEPVRTETARSDGGPLEWPAVKLAKGERLGRRTEEYHIRYHMPAGPDQDLNTYRMFWEPLAVGQRVALRRTRDGVEAHPYPVDSLSECRRWYRGLPGATPQNDLGCTPPPAKP